MLLKKLFDAIQEVVISVDNSLITKKEGEGNVVLVNSYDQEATKYKITIDGENFTLKLNHNEFIKQEKNIKTIKKILENFTQKTINIDETSGSITENKEAILTKIQKLSGYPKDLNGIIINVKDNGALLTLWGFPITFQLSIDEFKEEVIGFKTKRSKTIVELNKNKITIIKAKIINKDIILNANVDTLINENILEAIKKLDNSSSNDEDLNTITNSISSLMTSFKNLVILTITINSQSDLVEIFVSRSKKYKGVKWRKC